MSGSRGVRGARYHLPPGKTLEGFGESLKYHRLVRGYRHRDLAPLVPCSPSNLSRLENAKSCPTPQMVSAIAHALGVAPATLWG